MGMLLDGKWIDEDVNMTEGAGGFQRPVSTFRGFIGSADFPPEAGRYHLFTAPSCPWAHRTVIARHIKRLDPFVAWSQSDQPRHEGWAFSSGIGDLKPVDGRFHLHQLYTAADPGFTGRVTVPVLWDRKTRNIVNNESAEILRMFNTAFEDLAEPSLDLYPAALRHEIDAVNAFIYEHVNNGVYRCGFARSQEAYDQAFDKLFAGLDDTEERLGRQRYLAGSTITEADIRLFTTLVRFDTVYHGHFKCNRQRIADYPNLWNYLLDLYRTPGFGETVDMPRIKFGYYGEQPHINPTGIVPRGPVLGFTSVHDRNRFQEVPLGTGGAHA